MSTTYGPQVLVPGVPPEAPPFNLLDVAVPIPDAVEGSAGNANRVFAGMNLLPYAPYLGEGVLPCIDGSTILKSEGDPISLPTFGAFTAYLPITCSSFGNTDWEEFQRRADTALAATDHFYAEAQLVAGVYKDDNPYLGDELATDDAFVVIDNTNTARLPADALARLESALGTTGRRGVIHAPPGVIAAWSALGNALVVRGGRLETLRGTPVVAGDGYVGRKPLNADPLTDGNDWAWASWPVQYKRGPLKPLPAELEEALERTSNTITYRAERDLIVAFDPNGPQVAVLVDRSPA